MKIINQIILILVLFGSLYPCSCMEPPPPEEAYMDAGIVFSGEVTNIVVDESGFYHEVTFQIIDVWKGEDLEEITILTETYSDTCGYEFQIYNEYLVYAYNYNWGIYTNICTRTNLLEYASEDLDYLNSMNNSQSYPGIMIDVSGGTFIMGNNNQPPMSNDQDPEHSVAVDDFKIGETEVSNAYYVIFLNDMASLGNLMIEEGVPGDWASTPEEIANGHAWSIMADSTLSGLWSSEVLIKLSDIAGGGQHPLNRCWIELDTTSYTFSVVEGYENWPASWVSWYGAMMYVNYYGVTLPTEAEWEYAARAGQQLEYPTNDGNLSYSQANYGTGWGGPSGETYLTPIGEIYPPNPFGLYNMAGNVSEWCLDWYDEDFYQTCVDNNIYLNPLNDGISGDLERKVLRGGNHTYPSHVAMSSSRTDTPPFVTTDHMGFRVVVHNVQGDINNDGSIDVLDIVVAVNYVLSNEYNSSADLNSDSIVDVLDIVQLVNIILN